MPGSVRFELTPEDIEASFERQSVLDWFVPSNRSARRFRWSLLAVTCCLTLLEAWLFWTFIRGTADKTDGAALGFLFPLLIVAWGTVDRAFDRRRRISAEKPWLAIVWEGHRCAEHTVDVDETGVTETIAGRRVTHAWDLIFNVEQTPHHIFMDRRGVEPLIIPKRAFGSPADADALAEEARAHVRAAGSDQVGRLRASVADRDVPCPKCGYNLRGATSLRCPECGRTLDPDGLRIDDMLRAAKKEEFARSFKLVRRKPNPTAERKP